MEERRTDYPVILEKIDNIHNLMKIQHEDTKREFCDVKSRQDHTNGTVTENTEDINSLKTWRYGLVTASAVVWLMSGTIFYLFMVNLKNEISVMISSEIERKVSISEAAMHDIAKKEALELLEKNFNNVKK